jgi:hypothetical protein
VLNLIVAPLVNFNALPTFKTVWSAQPGSRLSLFVYWLKRTCPILPTLSGA